MSFCGHHIPTVTFPTYQSSLGYEMLYDANSSTGHPRILLKAIPSKIPLINTTPNQSATGENNSAHSSAEQINIKMYPDLHERRHCKALHIFMFILHGVGLGPCREIDGWGLFLIFPRWSRAGMIVYNSIAGQGGLLLFFELYSRVLNVSIRLYCLHRVKLNFIGFAEPGIL